MTSIRELGKAAAWRWHQSRVGRVTFNLFQAAGFHVTPNHFYSPIPDTHELDPAWFNTFGEMVGVDMRLDAQLQLIRELGEAYRSEYVTFPRDRAAAGADGFYLHNLFMESVDAEVLYSLLRQLKPRRIVEIGSGYSTLVALRAGARNRDEGHPIEITCVEPYPQKFLEGLAASKAIRLLREPVQEVELSVFEGLEDGDVLFIDSTHVLRTGSDVQYEFLELVPRMKPGVYVHVHDIFFPGEYPFNWVVRRRLFLNEQYVLQAFLAFNSEFEVTLSLYFLHKRHPELLQQLFPSYDPATVSPAGFWMRRRSARAGG